MFRRLGVVLVAACLTATLGIASAPGALADRGEHGHEGHGGEGRGNAGILYDSIPRPLPGNLPSWGFEATTTSEFGNEIGFADRPGPNHVGFVVVTMSSWGCQSGHWYTFDCSTQPGAKFTEPITLNIYNPPNATTYPGSLIATQTRTFSIPYRPSADNTHCTGPNLGKWYDSASNKCYNGLATNISFKFSPPLTLPDSIVFGIAYNTSTSGYSPYGVFTPCFTSAGGCGYDSLNVALSFDPNDLHAGSDPNPDTVFQYNSDPAEYCDLGANGIDVFRLDSPGDGCWSTGPPNTPPTTTTPAYIPSVLFT